MNFIRMNCPSRSHKKLNLYKLIVARSDIRAALSSCNLLIQTVDHLGHDLYYPLYASIVICYARPFTDSNTIKRLSKRWSRFSNPSHKKIHNDIIRARHELIAHSDTNVRQIYIKPPFVKVEGTDLESPKISIGIKSYYFPLEKFTIIRDTIQDLGNRLNENIEDEIENMYSGMCLPRAKFLLRIDEGL